MGTNNNLLAYLTALIRTAFMRKNTVIGVFLDIKGAYDNVKIQVLYEQLIEAKIPITICNLIYRILDNINVYIKDREGEIIGPKRATVGLVQGSPLSPLLFNIYIKKIFDIIPNTVKLLGYADDLVLLIEGNNVIQMTREINKTLLIINTFLTLHNLELAKQKCEAIWFKQHNSNLVLLDIWVGGEKIQYKKHVKYLGVTLQRNLSWDMQINNSIIKAKKGLNIIKAFRGTWWGADPKTLGMALNGLVRSHLEFAAFILEPTTQKNIKKLDSIYNQGLRIVTGCMRSTPIPALYAECRTFNKQSIN